MNYDHIVKVVRIDRMAIGSDRATDDTLTLNDTIKCKLFKIK